MTALVFMFGLYNYCLAVFLFWRFLIPYAAYRRSVSIWVQPDDPRSSILRLNYWCAVHLTLSFFLLLGTFYDYGLLKIWIILSVLEASIVIVGSTTYKNMLVIKKWEATMLLIILIFEFTYIVSIFNKNEYGVTDGPKFGTDLSLPITIIAFLSLYYANFFLVPMLYDADIVQSVFHKNNTAVDPAKRLYNVLLFYFMKIAMAVSLIHGHYQNNEYVFLVGKMLCILGALHIVGLFIENFNMVKNTTVMVGIVGGEVITVFLIMSFYQEGENQIFGAGNFLYSLL